MRLSFNGQTMEATPEMVAGLKAAGWVEVPASNGGNAKIKLNIPVSIDNDVKDDFKRNREANAAAAIGGVAGPVLEKHAAKLATITDDEQDGEELETGNCKLIKALKKLKRGAKVGSKEETDYYYALRVEYTIDGQQHTTNALAPRSMNVLPDDGSILPFEIVTRNASQSKTAFNIV